MPGGGAKVLHSSQGVPQQNSCVPKQMKRVISCAVLFLTVPRSVSTLARGPLCSSAGKPTPTALHAGCLPCVSTAPRRRDNNAVHIYTHTCRLSVVVRFFGENFARRKVHVRISDVRPWPWRCGSGPDLRGRGQLPRGLHKKH